MDPFHRSSRSIPDVIEAPQDVFSLDPDEDDFLLIPQAATTSTSYGNIATAFGTATDESQINATTASDSGVALAANDAASEAAFTSSEKGGNAGSYNSIKGNRIDDPEPPATLPEPPAPPQPPVAAEAAKVAELVHANEEVNTLSATTATPPTAEDIITTPIIHHDTPIIHHNTPIIHYDGQDIATPSAQPASAQDHAAHHYTTAENTVADVKGGMDSVATGVSGGVEQDVVTIAAVLDQLKLNAAAIRDTEELLAKLLSEQQQLMRRERELEEKHLIEAIPLNLGYDKGRPVVALLIHRCCLQWGAYQQDHTTIWEHVLAAISRQVSTGMSEGAPKARIGILAYWLSVCSYLLYCMNRTLPDTRAAAATQPNPHRKGGGSVFSSSWDRFLHRRTSSSSAQPQLLGKDRRTSSTGQYGAGAGEKPGSLWPASRRESSGRERRSSDGASRVSVEEEEEEMAPSPASMFRQALDAITQQVFHSLRDLVRKHMQVLLPDCAQIPADPSQDTFTIDEEPEAGNIDSRLLQYRPWCRLQSLLHETLDTLTAAYVPPALTQSMFEQLLSSVDVHLLNQLLLRPECCSTSNARYMSQGLKLLDSWLCEMGEESVGQAYFQLRHVRQACAFLVTESKGRLGWRDISQALCPSLNVQQLYRLCTTCWDDTAEAQAVSGEVLEEMKRSNVQSNGGLLVTFLLDEDHSLPFAAGGKISIHDLQPKEGRDMTEGMTVPEVLRGSSIPKEVFAFLELDLPTHS